MGNSLRANIATGARASVSLCLSRTLVPLSKGHSKLQADNLLTAANKAKFREDKKDRLFVEYRTNYVRTYLGFEVGGHDTAVHQCILCVF